MALAQASITLTVDGSVVLGEEKLTNLVTKGKALHVVVQMPPGIETVVPAGLSVQVDRQGHASSGLSEDVTHEVRVDIVDSSKEVYSTRVLLRDHSVWHDSLLRGVITPALEEYYATVAEPAWGQGAVRYAVLNVPSAKDGVDGRCKIANLLYEKTSLQPLHVVVTLPTPRPATAALSANPEELSMVAIQIV